MFWRRRNERLAAELEASLAKLEDINRQLQAHREFGEWVRRRHQELARELNPGVVHDPEGRLARMADGSGSSTKVAL